MNSLEQQVRTTLSSVADEVDVDVDDLGRVPRTDIDQRRSRRSRWVVGAVLAGSLGVGAAAAASGLYGNVLQTPQGDQMGGIENAADPFAPGGPFHDSGLMEKTPSQADRYVSGLGYEVTWQLDGRVWPEDRVPPDDATIDNVTFLEPTSVRIIITLPRADQ